MKKIVGIILTVLLCAAIAACGVILSGKNKAEEDSATEENIPTETTSFTEKETEMTDGGVIFETQTNESVNTETSEASDEQESLSTDIITEGTFTENVYVDDENIGGGKFQWR
ncbi:MAG: hypothetical protein ACI4JF_09035 [Oscillospiraceae bacterium]